MTCHNGSQANDYAGPGLENPHPFGAASSLTCTTCHGGNPAGTDVASSHVPPPPQIGDRTFQEGNFRAYFNRRTLTGIDFFGDYTVGGQTYSPLDWLRFVNPSDLRVVTQGEGCGSCHDSHAQTVAGSLLASEAGVFSGATFSAGIENEVPENRGRDEDTAADRAFRALVDTDWVPGTTRVGSVSRLFRFPVHSSFNGSGAGEIKDNDAYHADVLAGGLDAENRLIAGSPLADLYEEQVAFTCGDCHLGSTGANNRFGDFRPSGCAACHMPYSPDGRSRSGDPNVPPNEPANPDQIQAPERAHVRRHRIASVRKTLPGGEIIEGIDDMACAGCHQGSNRTVMQYWGIRLDQNRDVQRGVQYPSNPKAWTNTSADTRLFDPAVGNNTFNGRNRNQYLAFEDYDGDLRDDTPPDVHHEAGLGCIDCHGSYDLHGGDATSTSRDLMSRMEQAVAIRCESCHGGVDAYAATTVAQAHDGTMAEVAVDAVGNPLPHVVKEGQDYFLYSRLTGDRHYVVQTRDTVVQSTKLHPFTNQPVYSPSASYAMGRADGVAATGLGPLQDGSAPTGFAHTDDMDCASCHAAWTNNCIGCHLEGEYTTRQDNFSNITGGRIVFREREADFVYQSPVLFQLGISPENEIAPIAPNTEVFFRWRDKRGIRSQVFSFSDRNGKGNDPAVALPALSHNAMMPHSIRGKVTSDKEGARQCVACHLTEDALTMWGAEYDAFRTALATRDYASLDYDMLQVEIGENPGNQRNSPFWVHMVAGLGSGLFLFDENGCPTNPLDADPNRKGCTTSPNLNLEPPAFDLDRIVEADGTSNTSSSHAFLQPGLSSALRSGSSDDTMAGPLGAELIRRLTDPLTGIVLDSWYDADGVPRGQAGDFVGGP